MTGVDERGRPRAEWAPPDDGDRPYAFMEPAHVATVERRQATPEELEAARAREAATSHLVDIGGGLARPAPLLTQQKADAGREQASRLRGGEVNRQRIAASRPSTEEDAVPTDHAERAALDTFQELATAAGRASEAWAARQAAEIAWEAAARTLAEVLAVVDELVGARSPTTAFAGGAMVKSAPRTALDGATRIVARPKAKPRSRVGEGQRAGQASSRDERAALVMAAMASNGDDMAAVAAELGMKKNAVSQVVKFARLRAGV